MQKVLEKEEGFEDYSIREGLLIYRGKIYIENTSTIIPKLLIEFHKSPMGGHLGVAKTARRISTNFWWKGLASDVKEFVLNCVTCQVMKPLNQKPTSLLMPLPIPSEVWTDISMDFITNLPKVQGKTVIMVIVDRLTKYSHFCALPSHFGAAMVAEQFITIVVKLHGIPNTIVSDRDRVFTSKFWKELHKQSGTTLHFSSAYHP